METCSHSTDDLQLNVRCPIQVLIVFRGKLKIVFHKVKEGLATIGRRLVIGMKQVQ